MATEPLIELGSNYELDEDSNGNLVIRDINGNAILTYDNAHTRWALAQDIVPETSGTEQLGATGKAFGQLVSNAVGNDGSSLSVDDDLDLQSAQSITNASSVSTEKTHTKTIGANDYHYTGDYDGADADARLNTAITAASNGDTIYLENAEYSADLTISKRLSLVGTEHASEGSTGGTTIVGLTTWTFNDRVLLTNFNVPTNDVTININAGANKVVGIGGFSNVPIIVSGNSCILRGLRGFSITLKSGTSRNIVDASSGTTVTDNGSNTVGDIG
jgi:hypothetical protein